MVGADCQDIRHTGQINIDGTTTEYPYSKDHMLSYFPEIYRKCLIKNLKNYLTERFPMENGAVSWM